MEAQIVRCVRQCQLVVGLADAEQHVEIECRAGQICASCERYDLQFRRPMPNFGVPQENVMAPGVTSHLSNNGSSMPSSCAPVAPAQLESPSGMKKLILRDWTINYAHSSYYLEEIADLDTAAEALVRSRVVTTCYVADGAAYWLKDDVLRREMPDLRWREHEPHAHLKLPKDIDGWAAHCLARALLQRFCEKRIESPLIGPQHEYIRAAMEPSVLGFGDEQLLLCPTLKFYKTGVFSIAFELLTPEQGIGVGEFVEKYVNLFARWCDEAWVPLGIARAGATVQLYKGGRDRKSRCMNLGMLMLMRAAVAKLSEVMKLEDFEFTLYPAHQPLDDLLLESLLNNDGDEAVGAELTPVAKTVGPEDKPEVAVGDETGNVKLNVEHLAHEEPASSVVEVVADADGSVAAAVSESDAAGEVNEPKQSYMLSDMFVNAEYAVRATLDPPREGKEYIRRGLRPRLTLGNYWHCRPQVSIDNFDDQPPSAAEIREQFGDDLGRIMVRASSAPSKLARSQLGDSLRLFDDHSLHINSAISLCVYAAKNREETQGGYVGPAVLGAMERACLFGTVDYLAMRCRQLDERATLATSVAGARRIRTDLGVLETLSRNAFRAGELNEATTAACERLRLPKQIAEAREKATLAAEAATERTNAHSARLNVALTVIFGIVGAAGLTDSLTKPLWMKLGLPLPRGLEGPLCVTLSLVVVSFALWVVTRTLVRES